MRRKESSTSVLILCPKVSGKLKATQQLLTAGV